MTLDAIAWRKSSPVSTLRLELEAFGKFESILDRTVEIRVQLVPERVHIAAKRLELVRLRQNGRQRRGGGVAAAGVSHGVVSVCRHAAFR